MRRLILFPILLLVACSGSKGPVAPGAGATVPAGAPIATLNGVPITDEDIRKVSGARLGQAEMELYEAREAGVRDLVDDRLLTEEAGRRKVSKEDLLKKEVSSKIKVTDKEVEKFYNEKKPQMQGKKLDEVRGGIRAHLTSDQYQKHYEKLLAGLRKGAKLQLLILAPTIKIDEGDAPAIGPQGAPVRVVEFTDYQCPFCGRSRPTVNQILDTYKGKVRYVLKDFPLSFHKDAFKAHEAAYCAGDQGKYWEMSKKLFGNQREIQVEDLRKYAGDLKLDTKKFNDCLDAGKHADRVRQNQQQGQDVGVSGTPAFFVNGRMISGAQPFEKFKEVIDAELAKN